MIKVVIFFESDKSDCPADFQKRVTLDFSYLTEAVYIKEKLSLYYLGQLLI
jgi:hypothetical protein